MKLSFKQAHFVVYLILFPLWILKTIATIPFYITLGPIWLYDILWTKLNGTIFWDLQGKSRDFNTRVGISPYVEGTSWYVFKGDQLWAGDFNSKEDCKTSLQKSVTEGCGNKEDFICKELTPSERENYYS